MICNIFIYFGVNSKDVTAKRWVDSLNKCGDFTQTMAETLQKCREFDFHILGGYFA